MEQMAAPYAHEAAHSKVCQKIELGEVPATVFAYKSKKSKGFEQRTLQANKCKQASSSRGFFC